MTLDSGKKIGITRIHIEEDAGKLVHERGDTLVDYNRGGVPLIEVVSEPDIRSIDEAREYVEKLQLIMRTIGISDCKMQEGSLRCDVNISLRPMGAEKFGTRTEIKNMNSFTFMVKAMAYEIERQADLLDSGEEVIQETRRYDDATDTTESMRGKEDAQDYRYFRDPDLVTILTTQEEVEELRAELPELPDRRIARYTAELGLPEGDARMLARYRRVAEFFDAARDGVQNPKTVSNMIIGQVFRILPTEEMKEQCELPIPAAYLRDLVLLLESGKIRMNLAKSTLDKMLETGKPYTELISEEDMAGVDDSALKGFCEAAIANNPGAVSDYKGGKEKALKSLIGAVMKETRGKADAQLVEKTLLELLK